MDKTELEQAVIERLICPVCGGNLAYQALAEGAGQLICQGCGAAYLQEGGIFMLLTPQQIVRYQPFVARYRPLRQAEGWERAEAQYYLSLPDVPPTDPQAAIWRIRRRSFGRLQRLVGPGAGRWAVDLGAGNGWLSRRLSEAGFRVIGLDLNVVGPDSLAGGRLYQEQTGLWFGRVQATMEQLPLRAASFDLCVASGTLHYADLAATVGSVWRILAPGGQFVITDSPVYSHREAGQAMAAEYAERVKMGFGYEARWVGGSGFLVESELQAILQAQGFEVAFYGIERRLGRFKRRLQRLLKPARREAARFPVIVGRKPL